MRQMTPIDDADYVMAHAMEAQLPSEGIILAKGYSDLVAKVLEKL